MSRRPLFVWVVAFLGLTVAIGAGAGWYAYRAAMERLAEQGRADLALATDRLASQLMRYRELAVVLTSHPELRRLLFEGGDRVAAEALIREMADKTGALSIELVDATGRILAATAPDQTPRDPGDEPLARALGGALGTAHDIVPGNGAGPLRVYSYAAPLYGPDGPAGGAIIATVDVRWIENNWPGNAPAAYFVDDAGTVFISNRSGLLLTHPGEGDGFPAYKVQRVGGHEVWVLDGGRYLPRRALHLGRDVPAIGLRANVLLDAGPTLSGAVLVSGATMALFLVFGAAMLVAVRERRALDERLAVEAAANARLEARVTERTKALAEANADLRREIVERKEAEAALKQAQADLVQAGKLSALGQMSAGISHELNQPLMAIRSFAENGTLFFERGRPEKARENLGRITELSRRMGRIIHNLRAFARQENGPVSDVELGAIVEDALETTAAKLDRHGVSVDWTPPPGPVLVRGGVVRLQQVVVNLISNAADAMSGAEDGAPRRVTIAIHDTGTGRVTLSVRDTGPGLEEPERVFDPFYTTKAVGRAEGMGLGLSISYGLVQSFGGTIHGTNHPDGGAVFTVELAAAAQVAA
ncbi:MAG: sensor histidine kinase [Maritimibacter sp.]|nr:sensor histidine kinase [Maritimibacter sp.]